MMRCVLAFAAAVGLLVSGAALAVAGPILDQEQTSQGGYYGTGTGAVAQTITAGVTGRLTSVDVYVWSNQSFLFRVNAGTPGANPYLFSVMHTPAFGPYGWGWTSIDVSSAGIGLATGDVFAISMGPSDNGFGFDFGAPYADGRLYHSGALEPSDRDLTFRTFMDTSSVVPEPGTVALLALGMAGAALVRRPRRA